MTAAASRSVLRRFKVPLIVLKIGLSVALFAYVVAKVSPGSVWSVIRSAHPRLLLLAGMLFFFSNLVGSWVWARLLRARGVPIPYPKAAAYYFVGLFFNNFLPSNIGGDIARISDASKYAPHVSPVFSATLMDRLIGVLAIAFLALVASAAVLDRLHLYAIYAAMLIIFVVALGLLAAVFHRGTLEVVERPFRWMGARRIESGLSRLMDDLHGYRTQAATLGVVFLASTVVQVSRILVHYVVGLSLGVRVALSYYFLFVPVLAALISLPISLNGIGVREGAAVVLFQTAGMSRQASFAVPFLAYVLSVLISLLGGLIFVSRPPRRALGRILERRRRRRQGGAVPREQEEPI